MASDMSLAEMQSAARTWASPAPKCPESAEDERWVRDGEGVLITEKHSGLLFKEFNRMQLLISLVTSHGFEAQVKMPGQWSLEKPPSHLQKQK